MHLKVGDRVKVANAYFKQPHLPIANVDWRKKRGVIVKISKSKRIYVMWDGAKGIDYYWHRSFLEALNDCLPPDPK